ncbi:hypothetical protein [Nostoc sp. UHCC 0252]|nr:hypothetical protein [Nostoc sp. UHCC 0252]MEA5599749.1 hypothetical protein [Nostoc sp. UHCC 0252]
MLLVIMASVEQVMKEALALPSAARALLAEKLVEIVSAKKYEASLLPRK